MNDYTVIGFIKSTGKILSHYIEANSPIDALLRASELNPNGSYIACLNSHLIENQSIHYFGSTVVDAKTIIDQSGMYPEAVGQ